MTDGQRLLNSLLAQRDSFQITDLKTNHSREGEWDSAEWTYLTGTTAHLRTYREAKVEGQDTIFDLTDLSVLEDMTSEPASALHWFTEPEFQSRENRELFILAILNQPLD